MVWGRFYATFRAIFRQLQENHGFQHLREILMISIKASRSEEETFISANGVWLIGVNGGPTLKKCVPNIFKRLPSYCRKRAVEKLVPRSTTWKTGRDTFWTCKNKRSRDVFELKKNKKRFKVSSQKFQSLSWFFAKNSDKFGTNIRCVLVIFFPAVSLLGCALGIILNRFLVEGWNKR